MGVDEQVTFAGAVGQDDMPAYFRAADVFCQPSFNEGIPVVLMEAMASGLPVVSASVGAIDELVDDGGSGFLVTPARPSALANALRRLSTSDELRAAMGARGRTIVERAFDSRVLGAGGRTAVPGARRPEPVCPRRSRSRSGYEVVVSMEAHATSPRHHACDEERR